MTDLSDFAGWLTASRPMHEAWGRFVVEKVCELAALEISQDPCETFFKVLPKSRAKTIESALKKQASKRYVDPKEMMTDVVGARFVVLLKTDIDLVERVIVSYGGWTRSKDRDPDDERDQRPKAFDYQSVHYVVRNAEDRQLGDVMVPTGVPCEVQIRTLLQHAYAELVHGRIYKNDEEVPRTAERLVARCMALMETTDDIFCAAVDELESVNRARGSWCEFLDATVGPLIPSFRPSNGDEETLEILEVFRDLIAATTFDAVRAELNAGVSQAIRERAGAGGLFARPAVLLVYWLVRNHSYAVRRMWTLPGLAGGLTQIGADLGVSM